MKRPVVYMVIRADQGIGGAEKRLIGAWLWLAKTGAHDMRLVVNAALARQLRQIEEFAELSRFESAVTTVADGPTFDLRLGLQLRWLHQNNQDAVFHFVVITPTLLQPFRSNRSVFTFAATKLHTYNWRGRLGTYLGVMRAGVVDLLDPVVRDELVRTLPFKRDAMFVTPNSFVDLSYYRPAPFAQKQNRLCFLGNFMAGKQPHRLFDAIPFIDSFLAERGLKGVQYRFMGRESSPPNLGDAARALKVNTGIDVVAQFEPNPVQVLATSKVGFSLQTLDNYPSKALLETMACGCLPVITDVGQSRRMATEAFGSFVPRDFSPLDIATHCHAILSLDEATFTKKVEAARAFLAERFSLETMAGYYGGLYDQLAS